MKLEEDKPLMSIIVIHVTRFLLPFVVAFGIYVQVNSSNSPGGGFQAGAIIASGFILHSIVFGGESTLRVVPFSVFLTSASVGILIYLITGLSSVLFGKTFLDYSVLDNSFFRGQHGGIFMIEIGVGLTVFSVICIIFYSFIRGGGR